MENIIEISDFSEIKTISESNLKVKFVCYFCKKESILSISTCKKQLYSGLAGLRCKSCTNKIAGSLGGNSPKQKISRANAIKKGIETKIKKYGNAFGIANYEKQKQTIQNRPQEKRKEIHKKYSNAVKNVWKNKTKKERDQSLRGLKEFNKSISLLSEEEKRLYYLSISQKAYDTKYKKYGGIHPSTHYFYDNLVFDSSIELIFYLYLKDHLIPFEFHPPIRYEYIYENEKHFYYPDFLVEKTVIELKGNQFLKEDGTWKDIYTHNDEKMECKHQCLLRNNVNIIYEKDMDQYKKWFEDTYGKAFLKKCKNNSEQV
jgi:hypothetical protein